MAVLMPTHIPSECRPLLTQDDFEMKSTTESSRKKRLDSFIQQITMVHPVASILHRGSPSDELQNFRFTQKTKLRGIYATCAVPPDGQLDRVLCANSTMICESKHTMISKFISNPNPLSTLKVFRGLITHDSYIYCSIYFLTYIDTHF